MITYEQEKIKKKGSKKMVNIKTAESIVVVHTHTNTSLLKNNEINEFDIETTIKLSILC